MFDDEEFGNAVRGRLVYIYRSLNDAGRCCDRALKRLDALRSLLATKPFWDDVSAVFEEVAAVNSLRVSATNAYAAAMKYIDGDDGYLKGDAE